MPASPMMAANFTDSLDLLQQEIESLHSEITMLRRRDALPVSQLLP